MQTKQKERKKNIFLSKIIKETCKKNDQFEKKKPQRMNQNKQFCTHKKSRVFWKKIRVLHILKVKDWANQARI